MCLTPLEVSFPVVAGGEVGVAMLQGDEAVKQT